MQEPSMGRNSVTPKYYGTETEVGTFVSDNKVPLALAHPKSFSTGSPLQFCRYSHNQCHFAIYGYQEVLANFTPTTRTAEEENLSRQVFLVVDALPTRLSAARVTGVATAKNFATENVTEADFDSRSPRKIVTVWVEGHFPASGGHLSTKSAGALALSLWNWREQGSPAAALIAALSLGSVEAYLADADSIQPEA
ncbi:uncharacterized protein CLUP02_08165 [Colletotrichum lupini]|uniref:Uncharacterized protein n=1 Tax=Colletotrichum lupini TaxID=145971 RepID=A0A9Q8STB0_9PEZI|nr:uncharacterized protein CLUP02_08165 [Colletotrichum lupini]UQC82675.1 hypothetical protein CLUP02_08165 [Colletotrichum lupini]